MNGKPPASNVNKVPMLFFILINVVQAYVLNEFPVAVLSPTISLQNQNGNIVHVVYNGEQSAMCADCSSHVVYNGEQGTFGTRKNGISKNWAFVAISKDVYVYHRDENRHWARNQIVRDVHVGNSYVSWVHANDQYMIANYNPNHNQHQSSLSYTVVILENTNGVWSKKLVLSTTDINGSGEGNLFGSHGIGINGRNDIIVGMVPHANAGTGYVYLYQYSETSKTWSTTPTHRWSGHKCGQSASITKTFAVYMCNYQKIVVHKYDSSTKSWPVDEFQTINLADNGYDGSRSTIVLHNNWMAFGHQYKKLVVIYRYTENEEFTIDTILGPNAKKMNGDTMNDHFGKDLAMNEDTLVVSSQGNGLFVFKKKENYDISQGSSWNLQQHANHECTTVCGSWANQSPQGSVSGYVFFF